MVAQRVKFTICDGGNTCHDRTLLVSVSCNEDRRGTKNIRWKNLNFKMSQATGVDFGCSW